MFISDAFAQASAPVSATGSLVGTFIQIIAIFLVFYFLLIRPQQKRIKQHEAEIKAIKTGDQIMTGGGLYATVTHIDGDDITAEIAKDVEVKINRYTIREVVLEKKILEAHTSPKNKNTKAKK